MSANEKRYVVMSGFQQFIAEYTVVNFWYPIKHLVIYASALEFMFDDVGL